MQISYQYGNLSLTLEKDRYDSMVYVIRRRQNVDKKYLTSPS